MGLKSLVLLVSLLLGSAAYADCPSCRGQQVAPSNLPNVGVRGMTMKTHLERDHGVNTAGMSAAQMQAAHNQAHYGSGSQIVSRSTPFRNVTRIRIFRRR